MATSSSRNSTGILRRVPRSVEAALTQRYHPYFTPPISIQMMASPRYFHDRIEAFDKFNHHVTTYIGYLRRYEGARNRIRELSREMSVLEERMIEVHKKMEEAGREVVENLSSVTNDEEVDQSAFETDEDEFFDEPDVEVQPATTARSSSSSSSASSRGIISTLFDLSDDIETLERVTDTDGSTRVLKYKAETVFVVGTSPYPNGIRKRVYAPSTALCTLCDLNPSNNGFLKCSNSKCTGRLCVLCFAQLTSDPEVCPFCRARYEINPSSRDVPPSPVAIAPPAALSQEF